MKEQHSDPGNQALSRVLCEWKVKAPLPPGFQESVWHRIDRSESRASGWKLLFSRFAIALTRPGLATSYVTALLAVGLIAGYWQAKVATAHAEAQLSARYVQVIDPYQMPHH